MSLKADTIRGWANLAFFYVQPYAGTSQQGKILCGVVVQQAGLKKNSNL